MGEVVKCLPRHTTAHYGTVVVCNVCGWKRRAPFGHQGRHMQLGRAPPSPPPFTLPRPPPPIPGPPLCEFAEMKYLPTKAPKPQTRRSLPLCTHKQTHRRPQASLLR